MHLDDTCKSLVFPKTLKFESPPNNLSVLKEATFPLHKKDWASMKLYLPHYEKYSKNYKKRWECSISSDRTENPAAKTGCAYSHREFRNNDKNRTGQKPSLSPHLALLTFRESLTPYEHEEILNYSKIFYLGVGAKKLNKHFSDLKGKFNVVACDHIAYRYEIVETIGRGTFGEVMKCFDHEAEEFVAVKVLKRTHRVLKIAEMEVAVLKKLLASDPGDSKCLGRIKTFFEFRGHVCIVFELFYMTLQSYLRATRFSAMNPLMLRRIAVQTLIALKHLHSLGLIHCDLKPENIMLKSQNKTSIKLIDFGTTIAAASACFYYIQSRFYRAPEILLGAPYDSKIDIWSFGCVLYEFATGRTLFLGKNEEDQISHIVALLGPPPAQLLSRSAKSSRYFDPEHRLLYGVPQGQNKLNDIKCEGLLALAKSCLKWDPVERPSAEQALANPWIKGATKISCYFAKSLSV